MTSALIIPPKLAVALRAEAKRRQTDDIERFGRYVTHSIASVLCVSLLATNALADDAVVCPERPVDEDDRKALAGVWFSKGDELAAEGRYDEAVTAFQCSIGMVEHPDTIYNAAQAARLAGQHEVALQLLQRWLKLAPYDDMADDVVAQIDELEKTLGRNDRPAPPSPEEERAPGTGGEYIEHPDGEPREGEVSVLGVAGWAVLGVGAAAAIAGGVFQGLAAKFESEAEDTHDLDTFEDAQLKTDIYQKTAIAAFVVGGLALGAGVTMIVLGGGDDDDGDSADEVAIVPAPGGLLLRGSF